jgi:hypothetical protein
MRVYIYNTQPTGSWQISAGVIHRLLRGVPYGSPRSLMNNSGPAIRQIRLWWKTSEKARNQEVFHKTFSVILRV